MNFLLTKLNYVRHTLTVPCKRGKPEKKEKMVKEINLSLHQQPSILAATQPKCLTLILKSSIICITQKTIITSYYLLLIIQYNYCCFVIYDLYIKNR